MNPLIQLKKANPLILVGLALTCFWLLPARNAFGVVPAPDGGYPGQNTAEGESALLHLAGGTYNTALGWTSLGFNVTGNYNTGVGAATLLNNTADENTATGTGALLSNTTGGANTANGAFALITNTTGFSNNAFGDSALAFNTMGSRNTAIGHSALLNSTTGTRNTAIGDSALFSNSTGDSNIALGVNAGSVLKTANHVICIGSDGANVSNSCFIGQIFGATSSGGASVLINSNGRLGTMTSSARFKEDINPMNHASDALYALKPVTFRYKKDIDPQGVSQFGLVAEDVEKVNPDLIVRDKNGKPYSVRYDQVNAMLLNEFLKEHRDVQELKKQVATLTAGLQKVSAQLEASKPAPQLANNQ
jgi:Chaperone of endosialidase